MSRLTRREIPKAKPPHQLVPALGPGTRALDGCGPRAWGTAPGGRGRALNLLALDPELERAGGLDALEDARRWLNSWRADEPLAALLIGWLSYDLGREFESIPATGREEIPVPPVCLAGFRAVYVYDRTRSRGAVVGGDPRAVDRLAERVREAAERVGPGRSPRLPAPRPRSSDEDFRAGVRAIQRWIRCGDVYQVNLSRRLDLEPVEAACLPILYEQLTARAGAPFSAYLDTGDTVVLSNSPERFLRVLGDRIETCPIKGTRPRGRTPEEDAWLAKDLIHAEKDRAEHVMIVDLERNDLGRVCRTGTIQVRRMAELRRFPTVLHLVSSVQGQLREPGDWASILRATFPGGSITGAPKLRAMEIIDLLEPVRRGIYTGALGYFDAAGGLDLSIAIRTAVAQRNGLYLHLGGGIVADSDAEAELRETWDKARAFSALWGQAG
jgi:para-aminobenzoate synthetase component 1